MTVSGAIHGALALATPVSEPVRACVFGAEHVDRVTELHRLVMLPSPPLRLSAFVGQVISSIHADEPHLWALLSYADTTEGHVGVIYQACSFLYTGASGRRRTYYRDELGALRSPRQRGRYISHADAIERGWSIELREQKHRYLKILRRKPARVEALLSTLPYPRKDTP
jgi:hypothetical protein